ncbi:hypothetical protein KEM48_014081 [Puccinia striiformis f. sp. tritici PST-130]|nr:hypothetical protein KEM48_014081 [Puccinia striiformis f. sp. tritici PST-130]
MDTRHRRRAVYQSAGPAITLQPPSPRRNINRTAAELPTPQDPTLLTPSPRKKLKKSASKISTPQDLTLPSPSRSSRRQGMVIPIDALPQEIQNLGGATQLQPQPPLPPLPPLNCELHDAKEWCLTGKTFHKKSRTSSHPPSPFTSMIRALLYPKHDTRTQWTVRCQGPQATQRQQRKIRLNGSLKVSISISAQTVLVLLSVLQYFGSIPFTPIDLAMKCVLPYVLVSPYQFLSFQRQ